VDLAGEPYNFGSLDAFNAFQVERQAAVSWQNLQAEALRMADTLMN
jgi:hypothetical protein